MDSILFYCEKEKMENKKLLVRLLSNWDTQENSKDTSYPHTGISKDKTKELLIKDKEKLFIGQLVKNIPFDPTLPDRYCLEDNKLWLGASCRLGRVNIFSDKEIPANLYGQTVIVSGKKKRSMNDRIVLDGPCTKKNELLQFRDDWYSEEGGSFTTHQKLKGIEYIEVKEIIPIALLKLPDPLSLPRKGKLTKGSENSQFSEKVEIVVSNPLSINLENVRLVIHYEGGPNKNTPLYKSTRISLDSWEYKTLKVPGRIEEEWKEGKYSTWHYIAAYIIDNKGGIEFLGPPGYTIDH